MALPVNIDDLINHRKVEWARIEYKEGWNPEKVLHTLCAFAMRENGSPSPVFSSPENRDWFSVTLPVNPHFREMENPISQRTALKTALTSQREMNKENTGDLTNSGHIVEVMTAEEELKHIKVALKTALKTALTHRSAKVVERMGVLLQQLLRDKNITIIALASLLGASRRTVQEDIAILKNLKVLDRIGPDNGGEWVVMMFR